MSRLFHLGQGCLQVLYEAERPAKIEACRIKFEPKIMAKMNKANFNADTCLKQHPKFEEMGDKLRGE